jgi:hypothetical protein
VRLRIRADHGHAKRWAQRNRAQQRKESADMPAPRDQQAENQGPRERSEAANTHRPANAGGADGGWVEKRGERDQSGTISQRS